MCWCVCERGCGMGGLNFGRACSRGCNDGCTQQWGQSEPPIPNKEQNLARLVRFRYTPPSTTHPSTGQAYMRGAAHPAHPPAPLHGCAAAPPGCGHARHRTPAAGPGRGPAGGGTQGIGPAEMGHCRGGLLACCSAALCQSSLCRPHALPHWPATHPLTHALPPTTATHPPTTCQPTRLTSLPAQASPLHPPTHQLSVMVPLTS